MSKADHTSRGRGWFAGILLTSIIAVLLIPSGSWAASRQGLSGLDRIDQAYREGRLTYPQALNYKVDALFRPDELPAEFRPAHPLKSGTDIVREALAHREHLTAKSLRLLQRPTDSGSCTTPEINTNTCDNYLGAAVVNYDSPGGNFRLHYTRDNTHGDAVSLTDVQNADGSSAVQGDGIPDYVETYARFLEEAWDHEVTTLGFNSPPSDGVLGGNDRRDVYIKNFNAYGLTIYENTAADAYMIVENDYAEGFPGNDDPEGAQKGAMRVTAAHEFFHVIQWQISINCNGGGGRDLSNCWWMEASATWMEDEVYPAVNDYLNYLGDWFAHPQLPLDTYNGSFEYGTAIWAKYLSEKYGRGIVKEVWDAIDDTQGVVALEAIGTVLTAKGSSLAAELREFRAKNGALVYWDSPYAEGASYPGSVNEIYGDQAAEDYLAPFQGSCLAASGDCLLNPLSAYYYLFSAQNLSGSDGLTVFYQGKTGSAAVLVLPMTHAFGVPVSGSDTYPVTQEVSLDATQSGFLTVTPFGPAAQYKQVMVVVLNDGETASTGALTVCFASANCLENSRSLAVAKEGNGGGTVTSQPIGIDCGADCTGLYSQGMEVVLSATPDAGSVFSSWGGDPDCSDGVVTLNANLSCTAKFDRKGSPDKCFIATAAYGSLLHPYVQLLRQFRDRYLLPYPAGAAFVDFYYRHSPPLAERIANDSTLKGATEVALLPLIAFAAFMVKTTLLEKGLFFLVVWWGLRRRYGEGSRRL